MPRISPYDAKNYACFERKKWNQLIGCRVRHKRYRDGKITGVEGNGSEVRIVFKYGSWQTIVKSLNLEYHLEWIEVSEDLYNEIHQETILESSDGFSAKPESPIDETSQKVQPKFVISTPVCLKGQRNNLGIVIENIRIDNHQIHCRVFIDPQRTQVYPQEDLEEYKPDILVGNFSDFLKDLAVVKLSKRQNDHLYSLYASRTKFEVYQFKPALKFLSNPDQRLLIADEVGLGKTIEAGIIYLELQARVQMQRVLIICPSSLRQKWHDELKNRFDEDFSILNTTQTRSLLENFSKYGNEIGFRAIISLEAIRRAEIAEGFKDVMIDLLIIDEAHHCRNPESLSHDVASLLAENSDAVLLLTATPLQLGIEDFYNLLRILSPGEFNNLNVFIDRLEPNTFVNNAASFLAAGDSSRAFKELIKVEQSNSKQMFLKNPYYEEIKKTLKVGNLDRDRLIRTQRRLLGLNTVSNIFTRSKKRDILNTAMRRAVVLNVEQTREEAEFYQLVLQIARNEFSRGRTYGWSGMMQERQAASCLIAYKQKILAQGIPEITVEEKNFEVGIPESNFEYFSDSIFDPENIETIQENSVNNYRRLLRTFREFHIDSKFDVFLEALKRILNENKSSKVLVFSYFRATNDYLHQHLQENGILNLAIHGGIPVGKRNEIIDSFRNSPTERVLITSDVGAEGLDFQFCDTLFNYDLPWNPMKVEQRIGRIDRFGQESPVVRIYNLVLKNTIEDRILYRLYDRINIFREAIGDIEEILGEEIRRLTDCIFQGQLTKYEEAELIETTLNNVERRKAEIEEFETQRLQFMGQEAIFETEVNHTIETGRFVSDRELCELVRTYIAAVDPESKLKDNGEDGRSYCLQVGENLDRAIRLFANSIKGGGQIWTGFTRKLRPGGEIPITFHQEVAYERKLIEFITPKHLLAAAAIDHWKRNSEHVNRVFRFRISTEKAPSGIYHFYLYTLDSNGINPDTHLIPIVINEIDNSYNPELSHNLLRIVQQEQVTVWNYDISTLLEKTVLTSRTSERMIAIERDEKEEEIEKNNTQLINIRKQAIEQSYTAKVASVNNRLVYARDERIIRMYKGQLRNMAIIHEAKIKELDNKVNTTVSYECVLKGIFEVA